MSITVNFEVASAARKNGLFPVFLRVTENSRHYKMGMGVAVQSKKHFNAQARHRAWVCTKEPLAKVYNQKLEDTLVAYSKVERELLRRDELTAANIVKMLKRDDTDSIISYIDQLSSHLMKTGKFGGADLRQNLKKHLLLYSKGRDIAFKEITASFVTGFEIFLCEAKRKNGKPLCRNTMNRILQMLKIVYKRAMKDNLVISTRNPFCNLSLKDIPAQRSHLTQEEIETFLNLKLERGSELWNVRNYFLFSIFVAGMRVGDLIELKWKNITDTHITYVMRKTGHLQTVIRTDRANQILNCYRILSAKPDDYIFPIAKRYLTQRYNVKQLSQNKDYVEYVRIKGAIACLNSLLKELIALAGIKKSLSFHAARHTFAHLAADTTGNILLLSKVLGHSSLEITQHYLKGSNIVAQDQLIGQLFG